MKNYDAYSPGFFKVELTELSKLEIVLHGNKFSVREYFRLNCGKDSIEYLLYKIPKHLKRNRWDSAKLLVLHLHNGTMWAKRFNNSQHILID